MKEESLRQKKVSSLLHAELSQILIQNFRELTSGLISVTRVEMTKDLKKAHVYLSFLDLSSPDEGQILLRAIQENKNILKKAVASTVKLKYNPELIFLLDKGPEWEQKIDSILRGLKNGNK